MPWQHYGKVVDGHADTIVAADEGKRSFFSESNRGHLDLIRLRKSGVDLQVLAVCAEQRTSPYQWAIRLLKQFAEEQREHAAECIWLKDIADWESWMSGEKIAVLLALEGLEPLEGDKNRLEEFYSLGVRMATLTWNHANPFGAGVLANGGLSSVGMNVIQRMSSLGMALDLSHLHQEGFWQVVNSKPKGPVLVSHANAAALMAHPRNLSDDQIKAVADLGGTVGIALYPPFLTLGTATVVHALKHLEHIMKVGGKDCPALGCDFDGIKKTPEGIKDVTDLPVLLKAMEEKGWDYQTIHGIIGANLARVLRRTVG